MNENLQVIRTEEEAREKGRNGGKASGVARKRKKLLRELADVFGTLAVSPDDQKKMVALGIVDAKLHTRDMQAVISLYQKAMKGDVAAFNAIRDIKGEKPTDELAVNIPNSVRVEIVGDSDRKFASSEEEIQE